MTSLCCLVLSALVPGPLQSAATQPPDQPQSPPAQELPVSIDRIQRALATTPALRLNGDKPRFRVEVFGRKPTIKDFLGTVRKGPVPRGSSAHQEFLGMVTPDDVRGYAEFSNKEGIAVAVSSFESAMLMSAAQRAVRKLKAAMKEREKESARQEVAAALAALALARKDAGLPPK
jgi:hypothetical protein